MRVRAVCLLLVVAAGCESMRPAPVPVSAPPQVVVKPIEVPKPPVEVIRTAAAQPVAPPTPPPPAPPPPAEDDPLLAVAECLEREDYRAAVIHLDTYVRAHPDQTTFRFQLADLCARAGLFAEAKFNYERFITDAQTGPATLRPHMVTAHTKLMEIAQRRNDRFGELFHRGVGLLLLVKQMDGTPDRDDPFYEEMLCKSLRALLDAKELKPREPRVRVYLAEVLERTGNPRAATAERTGSQKGMVAGELTTTERGSMLLE